MKLKPQRDLLKDNSMVIVCLLYGMGAALFVPFLWFLGVLDIVTLLSIIAGLGGCAVMALVSIHAVIQSLSANSQDE